MKVFNACALVIRRRYAAFLIYLVIFTALSVVMTLSLIHIFHRPGHLPGPVRRLCKHRAPVQKCGD